MVPGPHRPGITYFTPQANGQPPEAAYWCRCGAHSRATGTGHVLALIDQWAGHCQACSLAPEPRRRQTGHQAPAAPVPPVGRRRRREPDASDGLWAA